jgi:hypothetical protein
MDKRSAMAKVGPPPAGRSSIQVACLDLVQHHEIIRFDDAHRTFDPERENAAFAPRSHLIESKE